MAINILSSNVGISDVLSNTETHLPDVDKFSKITASYEIENDFNTNVKANSFRESLALAFKPKLETDELLQSTTLNRTLASTFDKLKDIRDSDIRRFVREDFEPLMDNRELLKAFESMMVPS